MAESPETMENKGADGAPPETTENKGADGAPPRKDILNVSFVVVTVVAFVNGIWDAIFGMRAKYAARRLIKEKAGLDLQRLAKTSSERDLTAREMEEATKAILRTVEELPKSDRDYLMQGLRQSSRAAEERFVEELMSDLVP